jgi:hypothetical protein
MSDVKQDGLPWWRNDPWHGRHLFAENRAKFPAEEVWKYNGQFVAWFPDGSGIRDADPDQVVLRERIKAAGEEPYWYTIEYISDEAYI